MKKHIPIIILSALLLISVLSLTSFAKPPVEKIVFPTTSNIEEKFLFTERKEIYKVARDYVRANSVDDLEFSLIPNRLVNSWIVFDIIPENVDTDVAQVFLQKKNGKWTAVTLGTAFPELEESHPELFK